MMIDHRRPAGRQCRSLTYGHLLAQLTRVASVPADVAQQMSDDNNQNAKFEIKNTASSFTIDLRYSRYQFVPALEAILVECRSLTLLVLARE